MSFGGEPASHLTMYLEAMDEISADHSCFDQFIVEIGSGRSVPEAAQKSSVPGYVLNFIQENIRIACEGRIEEVASNFLYGREDAIPKMFTCLLNEWAVDENSIPRMTYYLKRHIQLDRDEHGPAAHRILEELTVDAEARQRSDAAAFDAVTARIQFWDGILEEIRSCRQEKLEESRISDLELA